LGQDVSSANGTGIALMIAGDTTLKARFFDAYFGRYRRLVRGAAAARQFSSLREVGLILRSSLFRMA
jgi:hypothetical protein